MAYAPIDLTRLPMAYPSFNCTSYLTLAGSAPYCGLVLHVTPSEFSPNLLLFLVYYAFFFQPSAFFFPISSPSITLIAEEGVLYNLFHLTALCSPTRAALLTCRYHHAVCFFSIC